MLLLTVFAQDVIYKKDSTRIQAKVSEVTETVIKYKKFSNPTGPSYELSKSEIVKIVYPDGSVDDFVKENESSVKKQVNKVKEVIKATADLGLSSNGSMVYKLNSKDYSTEYNKLQVLEAGRGESVFGKNRSAVIIILTSTAVVGDKRTVVTFTMTQNNMKPKTFKSNSANSLESVDGQFSTSLMYINTNNTMTGGGNNVMINNVKTSKLTIETIDTENRKISGSFKLLASSFDGGKVDLEGTFTNINY